MKKFIICLLLGYLIVTNRPIQLRENNGNWEVTYEQYCVEQRPEYRANGDLVFGDEIRTGKNYTVFPGVDCRQYTTINK